jgi:hypothetical protein
MKWRLLVRILIPYFVWTCKKKKKKSLDLPLYFFLFSPHMYICTVINNLVEDGYCEASSYYGKT